jgi:hypothetical protein
MAIRAWWITKTTETKAKNIRAKPSQTLTNPLATPKLGRTFRRAKAPKTWRITTLGDINSW